MYACNVGNCQAERALWRGCHDKRSCRSVTIPTENCSREFGRRLSQASGSPFSESDVGVVRREIYSSPAYERTRKKRFNGGRIAMGTKQVDSRNAVFAG